VRTTFMKFTPGSLAIDFIWEFVLKPVLPIATIKTS
jgi:hypothetical protein